MAAADRRPCGSLRLALTLVLACAAGCAWAGDAGADRFRVQAELRPKAISADGRFEVAARLTPTLAAPSTDGRYALKQAFAPDAGCGPVDAVFADGFDGN